MPEIPTLPLSLYVHFPWCVRKCPYCDFNSYTLRGELEEQRYVEALERDLASQAAEVRGREVISIFFGGGTPSLFSPSAVGRVIDCARRHLALAPGVEVTMEANPGAVERGRFGEYRAAGITRVSLGAQSFDQARLTALGRIHSPDETRLAADELHASGLDNFNLDLMYALPGQDVASAVRDVEEALALNPAHLSHYQLTIEHGTVFEAQPPALPDDDLAADMLAECARRLADAGFAHYEVSAYARPGRQCRHNLNYWMFGDYLGVGAGAHGKLTTLSAPTFSGGGSPTGAPSGSGLIGPSPSRAIVRTQQQREPRRYLATSPGAMSRSELVPGELPFEFMLNALRLVDGFDAALFSERTGIQWEDIAATVDELMRRGLLLREGVRIKPTPQGLRFLNELLLSFIPEQRRQKPKMSGAFGLSTPS